MIPSFRLALSRPVFVRACACTRPLSARSDLDIDIEVTWTTRGGYHMTRRSLCVLSTTVYSPGLALYTANLISPISTALRRPHDAIYTGLLLFPRHACHTYIHDLPCCHHHRRQGNISRGRARRFRGVEYIVRRAAHLRRSRARSNDVPL